MSDQLLRQYETWECTEDGYPRAWNHGQQAPTEFQTGQLNDGPVIWPAIKNFVREKADYRCQRCQHPYKTGDTRISPHGEWSPCDEGCTHGGPFRYRASITGKWCIVPQLAIQMNPDTRDVQARWRILTVHHLDEDKCNCRWWNLAALCQRCHLRMQRAVVMDRVYSYEHSDWFKPYAAGFYAFKYLDCSRCGGTGQEPFDDHPDSSQNPHVRVSCDRCGGSGKEDLSREETLSRLDEFLALEHRFTQEAIF